VSKDDQVVMFDMKKDLAEYFKVARPYALFFGLIAFFVLLMSLATVGEKFVFKILLDEGANFVAGGVTKAQFIELILSLALAFIGVFVTKAASNWLRLHFINRAEGSMMLDLKKKFFGHIVGLSYKFHTTHRTGSLIARMTRGAGSIEGITDFISIGIFTLIIQMIVVFISVAFFDLVSAVMLIVVMFAFIFYVLFFLRAQQKARVALNNAEDSEKAFVSDVFTNIDTIKYFGKENRTSSLFVDFASKTKGGFIKNWDFDRWTEAGQTFIIGAGIMLLLYFPLIKFLNGEISIGTIAFIYTVYLNVAEPLGIFIWGMRRFYQSLADFHSLTQYGDLKKDVVDKVNAPALKISKGKIEFNAVSFTYHKKEVINNFSLKVNPNDKVAIVGYSGSGKTTLIKLLYRLYDLNAGSIFIDGKNISGVKQESLRSELSIVPQECILFNDTIYNNVVFANPKAPRSEVISALKAAQLYDFVIGLPEKENTFVGERGIKLSGGEKQRLSIARAILAKKKVLVLDEATSSLDSKTESQIKEALNLLMKNKTTIIIAHRLSTIMEANKIIVLDKGRIVQSGKHNELINQKGIYKGLWNMQKGGYIE